MRLIAESQDKALRSVNTALIDLYWTVGKIISRKIASAEWEDAVVPKLAAYIARSHPGLRGFTRASLFRMRQFYEAYRDEEKVAPLVRQIPWTHHLLILSQSKQKAEREFLSADGGAGRVEQARTGTADRRCALCRIVLSPPKVSPAVRQTHPEAVSLFRNAYNLEFLGLPAVHAEADPHRALLDRLRES